ncbi:MAG TPA: alpha/beta hydrolase-fold protein [Vicinamibacterales bacterium]|jgi:enterochelin esterase family protein
MVERTTIAILLLATATGLSAQSPAPNPLAPAVRSPEVGKDARVTLRIAAPNAKAVTVAIEGSAPRPMQSDEKGVWTLTTEPLEPDYYGYSFNVDGSRVFDSANARLVPNLLNPRSLLHVPGDRSLPWEMNDVPHGTVHRYTYASAIGGDTRDLYVYTPPGYDASAATRYPVLYLLHGFSDDASAWTAVGQANIVLDNLIARGAARPMIVAMPLGYGVPEIVRMAQRDASVGSRNVSRFGDMMLAEIIPLVERSYRAITDRGSRAIAGLSMGGSESPSVGLNHLDTFAAVGAFSSAVRDDFASQFPHLTSGANHQLKTLWIACGTSDRLIDGNRAFREWLTARQIKFTGVDTPGLTPGWSGAATSQRSHRCCSGEARGGRLDASDFTIL